MNNLSTGLLIDPYKGKSFSRQAADKNQWAYCLRLMLRLRLNIQDIPANKKAARRQLSCFKLVYCLVLHCICSGLGSHVAVGSYR